MQMKVTLPPAPFKELLTNPDPWIVAPEVVHNIEAGDLATESPGIAAIVQLKLPWHVWPLGRVAVISKFPGPGVSGQPVTNPDELIDRPSGTVPEKVAPDTEQLNSQV